MTRGASLTTTPLLTPGAVELAKRYGTTDIEEAIRREMAEVAAEERHCAWPDCTVDLAGEHPLKQYCDEHRAQRDRESRRKGGPEMRGTMEEILHDKVQEMRQMRPQEDTMKQRTCQWPGCNADISGTHSRTQYCAEHKDPAAKKAQQEYRERKAAEKKDKKRPSKQAHHAKPAGAAEKPEKQTPEIPAQEEIEAEHLCDSCKGELATCVASPEFGNGKGNDNVVKCDGYVCEGDPRPAPEDYRPPIERRVADVESNDLIKLVPALRAWETDMEAKAYLAGFLRGRAA
jgi:hypothetical protein